MTNAPDRLLTAPEAADYLRISPRLLWTLTNHGDIRCTRIARRVLYRPETLREYAQRRESSEAGT